jgi:hypothetical protein
MTSLGDLPSDEFAQRGFIDPAVLEWGDKRWN